VCGLPGESLATQMNPMIFIRECCRLYAMLRIKPFSADPDSNPIFDFHVDMDPDEVRKNHLCLDDTSSMLVFASYFRTV
jgi:hypothetical protein